MENFCYNFSIFLGQFFFCCTYRKRISYLKSLRVQQKKNILISKFMRTLRQSNIEKYCGFIYFFFYDDNVNNG